SEMYKVLAEDLPDYAKEFWDKHLHEIEVGINRCGINERFYRFIGENICRNIYDESVWKELFSAKTLEEQQAFYEKYLTTQEWKTAVKILLSKTSHLLFFPHFMFANASENDFGHFFMNKFEKEVKTKPIHNNYFLSQIILSSYYHIEHVGVAFDSSEDGIEHAIRNSHDHTSHHISKEGKSVGKSSIDAIY